jgi:hypothetical protein
MKSELWQDLQSPPLGTAVSAWSAASGYDLKTAIRLEAIDNNSFTVTSNGKTFPRRIPRQEVEMIHSHWADYCERRYPRYKLRDKSKNSTYIIAILHWLLH